MSETLKNYKNSNFPEKKDCTTYLIPVQWSMYSTIRVEADNLQEALDLARAKLFEIPLTPNACEYIEDSYCIQAETDEELIDVQNYRDISSIVIDKDGNII